MKKVEPSKPPPEEYSRFEQLAREIIAVPKRELDKCEAAYQRKTCREETESRVNLIAAPGQL